MSNQINLNGNLRPSYNQIISLKEILQCRLLKSFESLLKSCDKGLPVDLLMQTKEKFNLLDTTHKFTPKLFIMHQYTLLYITKHSVNNLIKLLTTFNSTSNESYVVKNYNLINEHTNIKDQIFAIQELCQINSLMLEDELLVKYKNLNYPDIIKAINTIKRIDETLLCEMKTLMHEVVVFDNKAVNGFISWYLYGYVMLRPHRSHHTSDFYYIEHLIIASTQLYLLALSTLDKMVMNPINETFKWPEKEEISNMQTMFYQLIGWGRAILFFKEAIKREVFGNEINIDYQKLKNVFLTLLLFVSKNAKLTVLGNEFLDSCKQLAGLD